MLHATPKETICLKCQILISRKNKKKKSLISILSSAEFAHRMVSVKAPFTTVADNILFFFFFFRDSKTLTFHVNHPPSRQSA